LLGSEEEKKSKFATWVRQPIQKKQTERGTCRTRHRGGIQSWGILEML